jgi:hypothetical protein
MRELGDLLGVDRDTASGDRGRLEEELAGWCSGPGRPLQPARAFSRAPHSGARRCLSPRASGPHT